MGQEIKNIIKVLTDKGDVDVPDMPIVEQKISTNLLHWQYLMGLLIFSLPVKNQLIPLVYRIDNVSLTGIAK